MSPEQIALRTAQVELPPLQGEIRHRKTRTKTKLATVAIVGLGYVGLPLAILASTRGYRVVGFDIDENKVRKLARRESDFITEEESAHFKDAADMTITDNAANLLEAGIFIICVPTPVHEDHTPDLRPLEGAAHIVGTHLSRGALVVIESTVNPGVCEDVVLPILLKTSGLSRGEFSFAHCPERVNPGDPKWNVRTIPRVLGGADEESMRCATKLYATLIDAPIVAMNSIKEAEAVKMVENTFRDINIAFVNELAMAFDRAGLDTVNIIKGAATKPFGFMPHYPGCGVGGHCIPVDPYYLIRYGREHGFEHRFLMMARSINDSMPKYVISALESELRKRGRDLTGLRVALLGLAYKRDIPDMRESPALVIRDMLIERGATVHTYDPHIADASTARSLRSALTGAEAVVIATDHALFRALTPRHFEEHEVSIVLDGRNCLDKDAFANSSVAYRGIGRG